MSTPQLASPTPLFLKRDAIRSYKKSPIVVPPITIKSPRSLRIKQNRNNQIISQSQNGELVVIKNECTKSYIEAIEETRPFTILNACDKMDCSANGSEEQATVIENDCENDYSLIIKSLTIHN